MSTPGLVALIGNTLATASILPHLAQAVRDRRPTGSPYGWALGGLCAGLWLVYGWMTHTPEIGAPGYLTVPISTVLGVWAWRGQRADRRAATGGSASAGEPGVDLRALALPAERDVELAA